MSITKSILEEQLEKAQWSIDDIKAKLEAMSEVTYSVGDRFLDSFGAKCMLVIQVRGHHQVSMAFLSSGCLLCGSYEVKKTHAITQKELDMITGRVVIRYRDSEKKVEK